ncbi:7ddc32db-99d0-47ce-9e3c-761d89fb69cf [Thermothielavioides terrestris]|uniref:7ddc32db-99d0-47ce-9e3c-761d89fb69cf n=1 Tax=Thermothielavioides terrestris TaxID=2587410 RepID=A0A3S4C4S9_9PEZI|nr:7ddc32db-99d0-47ce-9e3c-761d89fb69cf [Thermothielavioides terrestris]
MAASAAGSLLNLAQRSLDRVFPPRSREQAYTRIQEFATARPLLFTFLLTQTLLTLPPILLFTTFALSTLLFTLLLAAATTLFLAGAALLFLLLPALCAASAVALCAWAWAVAAFLFGRWALRAVVLRPQQQQQPAPAPASAPALAPALAPSSPASAATPSSAPPSGSAPAVVGTEDKEGERGGDEERARLPLRMKEKE